MNTYGYALGNPLSGIDPFGLCVWDLCVAESYVAVTAAVATTAVVTAAVAAAVDAYNNSGEWDWIDDPPEAGQEHDEYKDRYAQPMPPGLDPCEQAKWELARERTHLRDMQRWDRRWRNYGAWNRHSGNRHAAAIAQKKQAIKNKKKKVERLCKDQCETK